MARSAGIDCGNRPHLGTLLDGTAPDRRAGTGVAHAISLHFMHDNFCRPHQTLTKKAGKKTTPAMAAGIARTPWSLTQLAELLD